MSVFILKIIGIAIVVAVATFAGLIYVNASKMEKEIEAEVRGIKEK